MLCGHERIAKGNQRTTDCEESMKVGKDGDLLGDFEVSVLGVSDV